jgi:hypothetical protein
MRSIFSKALAVAAVATCVAAAPAAAAPAEGGSALQQCRAGATFPWGEPFPSQSSCITFLNTGKLTGTSFKAQCKALTGGEYPITFVEPWGTFTAGNPGQCIGILRSFHSMMEA